ncbi:MAG: hypothetical protein ACI8X5_002530 [Planctomycetota bacterium]|jgi:hypothetical protein
MTTRRTFLALLGTLSACAGRIPRAAIVDGDEHGSSPQSIDPRAALKLESDEIMDEALEMLAPYAGSFRGGLSNHGPMAAEALVGLGRHDVVIGWVEKYRKRLEKSPAPVMQIDASNWREALGDKSRSRDWDEWFANELAESAWRDVVGLWVPRLAPGIAAAGLHGVIRVGHAVSSLKEKESAPRLDELARALAYWAAEFMLLPGELSGVGEFAPSRALRDVVQLPLDARATRGLITSEMKDLRGFQPFVGVINIVDTGAGSPDFMAELVATFAGIYTNTRSSSFEFLHSVTGAAAIVELLPYVKPEERALVMAYTWQVTAGVFARYGQPKLVGDIKVDPNERSAEQLAKLAVASGDEHTIKLVCACTREWHRNPDPRFMAAASRRVR